MSYIDDARQALVEELAARDAACEPELLDLYTLLVLWSGELTDLEEVHDAWAAWTSRRAPDHRPLVEFDDLAPDDQKPYVRYRDAIRAAAEHIADSGPEHRVQVYVRIAHPALPDWPEQRLGDVVLGRGPSGRQVDVVAALPQLLREAADYSEAHHLPADTVGAGGEH